MFSKPDYDEYDQPCKQKAIAYLPGILEKYEPGQYDGLKLIENPHTWGIDLIGMTNHGPLHVEVEYKKTKKWNGPFEFEILSILERKRKYITSVPSLFVVFNHNYTQIATTTGAILSQIEPVERQTRTRGWDWFIDVPRIHVKAYPFIEEKVR